VSTKDYYVVLGVSHEETAGGIRTAYRRLAKELHPDRAGSGSAEAFRELEEAYRVLSDPRARRQYNESLRRVHESRTGPSERPRRRPRREPEVVTPEPRSLFGDPTAVRPSFDALYARWRANFQAADRPKSEHVEELVFEVVLTPFEAAQGGVVPIGVPVFRPCPVCDGTGHDLLFPCSACRRQGVVEDEEVAHVRLPPMVQHGTILEVPLRGLGIHNFHLRLHIAIGEA
jgi:molecular chaperone DnaJ